MEKEFITLVVAPYALPKLLLALYNEGIKRVSVTQEDDNLEVRISKEDLESKKFVAENCCDAPFQYGTPIEITTKPRRGRPRKNK